LNIHVSDAKDLLYSFYLNHKDEVEATFIILGQLRETTDQLTIKVTKNLDDQIAFEHVDSVQLYALGTKNLTADEIAQTVRPSIENHLATDSKLKQWGVIKGPEFVLVAEPARTKEEPKPASKGSLMDSVKSKLENKASTPFPDMGLASARILDKYKKKEGPKKSDQPTIGASFTKQDMSKSKRNTRKSTTESPEPEVIEDEDLNDEEYTKKQQQLKEEKYKKKKALESMFDDNDGFEVVSFNEIKQEKHQKKEDPKKEESQSKHADLEGVFDSSFSQSQSQSQSEPVEDETIESKEPKTTSAKSVKEETVTSYYDEDGYLVTKVESFTPKPKPRASTSPSAAQPPIKKARTGPKQQSSLMNFFGRKKN
jgi:hypothetical protein